MGNKQEKLLSILGRIQKDHEGFCVGFFNIESGQVAISDGIFLSCDACISNFRSITEICTTCGKDGTNYIKFKSGSGDGVYSLFRFVKREVEPGYEADESIGGLIFLDWAKNAGKVMPDLLDDENPRLKDLEFFYDLVNDCEGKYIGSVICKKSYPEPDLDTAHCLYVSDAYIGKNGEDAILASFLSPGEYAIFLFESLAIFIRSDKAKKYGLIPHSRLSKIELENFALGKENEGVRSHTAPMGPQTIIWNSYLAEIEMDHDSDDFLTYYNAHREDGNWMHPYWELFSCLVQMEHLEIDGAKERVAGFTNPNNPLLHRSALVGYLELVGADHQFWTDFKLEILESLGILQ